MMLGLDQIEVTRFLMGITETGIFEGKYFESWLYSSFK